MDNSFVKKPCPKCPFRKDLKPFLRTARGEELAYAAQNPYNEFICHVTLGEEAEVTTESKTCAGFLTLMAQETGMDFIPEGFVPSYDIIHESSFDMAQHFDNE